MKFVKKNGETSVILRFFVRNSSVTTGAGLTGLTSGSSGLIVSTIANNEATATAYTGANLETITTLGTYAAPTSGKARFKEVDATNFPGIYEVQLADARFAVSGAKALLVMVLGATNAEPVPMEIQLDAGEVIADQIVGRNINGGSNTGRTIKQALHFLRNKWVIASGSLTVYDTDDSTVSWGSSLTNDAAATPIIGSDPT